MDENEFIDLFKEACEIDAEVQLAIDDSIGKFDGFDSIAQLTLMALVDARNAVLDPGTLAEARTLDDLYRGIRND